MFTRKISADSFDQSLLNERNRHTTDFEPKSPLEPEAQLHQSFDPDTGEIFQKGSLHSPENSYGSTTQTFSQKVLRPELHYLKNIFENVLPPIIVNLVFVVALAWLAHGLMTESNTKIAAQTSQLKQINQGQSDILDAIDDLHDNLSDNLLDLLNSSSTVSTSPLEAVKTNVSNINITPSSSLPIKQRSSPPKPAKLNGIKYLGSIKRHDMHQVLLEVDGKIMTLRIGDPVKAGWILSAIDEKKIIATTLFGDRQVIDLTKSGQ